MTEPFYLFSRTGFAPNNGTSVQLSRLLAGKENQVIHLLWDTAEAGAQSLPYSIAIDDRSAWQWPFSRGKGLYAKLARSLQLTWWSDEEVGTSKLARHLRRFPIAPRFAYVICMREWDARRILALWNAVGRPEYVLHVMDIFHLSLNERETPAFIELIRNARHVICISSLIESEVKAFGARETSILVCGTDFIPGQRDPARTSLRVVMGGAIWSDHYARNSALEFLETAWPEIVLQHPHAELHYAGADGAKLPAGLRAVVKDHGLLDQPTYMKLLHGCDIAYLAVSHPSNSIGRYSVPSRLVDYFAVGLPTITCTDQGTSIASFMKSVPSGCAANIEDVAGLVGAINRFGSNPSVWSQASAQAIEFAQAHLKTDRIREALFAVMSRCLSAPRQLA